MVSRQNEIDEREAGMAKAFTPNADGSMTDAQTGERIIAGGRPHVRVQYRFIGLNEAGKDVWACHYCGNQLVGKASHNYCPKCFAKIMWPVWQDGDWRYGSWNRRKPHYEKPSDDPDYDGPEWPQEEVPERDSRTPPTKAEIAEAKAAVAEREKKAAKKKAK